MSVKNYTKAIDWLTSGIESARFLASSGKQTLTQSPVFIIALPRSGSTLLYQLMINSRAFCFFNNVSQLFPKTAVTATQLSSYFAPSDLRVPYQSSYGYTAGLFAPHQSGSVWSKYMTTTEQDTDEYVFSESTKSKLIWTIESLQRFYNLPFINKWQRLAASPEQLDKLFPNAHYIFLRRELASVGHSIINARDKHNVPLEGWFSTKLKEHDIVKNEPVARQVAYQVVSLEERLKAFISLPSVNERVYEIDYSKLVSEPANEALKLFEFLNASGVISTMPSIDTLGDLSKVTPPKKPLKANLSELHDWINFYQEQAL